MTCAEVLELRPGLRCPSCGSSVLHESLVHGSVARPRPMFDCFRYWRCVPCDAWLIEGDDYDDEEDDFDGAS